MGGQQEAGEAKIRRGGLYLSTLNMYEANLVVRDKVQKRHCDKASA